MAAPAATQAGGGSAQQTIQSQAIVLKPHLLKYAETLYADKNISQFHKSADDFKQFLASPESNALEPPAPQDQSLPISNYFISSSHNTYLMGNQLSSESSAIAYKNVLLRGCRCVEIDVWDGESPPSSPVGEESPKKGFRARLGLKRSSSKSHKSPKPSPPEKESTASNAVRPWKSRSDRPEPIVSHGYTLTSDVPFRAVCETIRDCAFVTSTKPVILSLEVHTSLEQQEVMVEIMQECFKGLLVDLPSEDSNLELPKLQDLEKKVLIKVKYSPPKPPAEATPAKPKDPETSSSSSSSDEEQAKKPKPKVLEALSRLGVYTRSYHFKDFDQPEAHVPTHIFSISERSLMTVHEEQPTKLFCHNKKFLMRTYPKGVRISSSNLDPVIFWRKGVQIVALNWQRWDAGMMLNEAMFAGTGGWVLKPKGYLHASDAVRQNSASKYCELSLSIEFIGAQDIPLPPEDDHARSFKPYVKCELHIEKPEERLGQPIPGAGHSREGEYKVKTKTVKGQDADFHREVVHFRNVAGVVEDLSFLRFKIMDDELGKDDLAAWACFRLDRLRTGPRIIHLFDAHGVQSKGALFVNIKKEIMEHSSLAGKMGAMKV